jgi:transcriptional regulator
MYVPRSFAETDRDVLFDLAEHHGFATLVGFGHDAPIVSHVPLLVDRSAERERLVGHVARANPHWKEFDGERPALAIFQGPHAYVSPSWFKTLPAVPTWNYAVVHVHGKPRTLSEEATRAVLRALVEKYESKRKARWNAELPGDFLDAQVRALVGFELPIDRIEGKFKLSQNRSEADLEGILSGLDQEGDDARELAAFTRRYFARERA